MRRRVILRPEVPDDLHSIVVWLEQHSIDVANRFAHAALAAFEELAEMPGKGGLKHFPRSGLVGVRSCAVPGFPNHLVFYETRDDAIIVLAVLYGGRDIPRILKKRAR